MNNFANALAKLSNSLVFKAVFISCGLLLTIYMMLQMQDAEVHYIYNNF